MKKSVVIIGAGPAGLTCAYQILKENKNDYDVVILEKENTVGGISKSVTFNGYTVDTGIHRYFTKNDTIRKIWEELLPLQNQLSYDQKLIDKKINFRENGSNPEIDEKSLLIKDRKSRIYYGKKFYDYPVSINKTMLKQLGLFEIFLCGMSYFKSVFIKKKEDSLENFYINKFGHRLYRMFFESYTEKVWGVHPRNLSSSWGEQRAKGLSIRSILFDGIKKKFNIKNKKHTIVSLTDRFVYPKLGSLQMWNTMKDEIINMGGSIILGVSIKKINTKNNKIVSVSYLEKKAKKEILCDFLVSSMPIKDLFSIFDNHLKIPQDIYDAAVNLPYREFMSACLVLKSINWKNDSLKKNVSDIPVDSWDYIQDPSVKLGRIQIFNNWSCYLFRNKEEVSEKILIGLEYFCSENDEFWKMKDQDFIDFAIKEIMTIGLISSKDDVLYSTRIKIEKAYPSYFGTYYQMDEIQEFLNSIDNLYCIGRNGQHRYNNIDHAMLTGVLCAKNIIKNKKSKEEIWNVNTEQVYHEAKEESITE